MLFHAPPALSTQPVAGQYRAPGCRPPSLQPGGCWGDSIVDFEEVRPSTPCLVLMVNNCNGGTLEVMNSCKADLRVGGLDLPYEKNRDHDSLVWLRVLRTTEGVVRVVEPATPFAWNALPPPLPARDTGPVRLHGSVGAMPFMLVSERRAVTLTPPVKCLDVGNNGFAEEGTELVIGNHCKEIVLLEGAPVRNALVKERVQGGEYWIELFKDQQGRVRAKEADGNYASYSSTRTEFLSAEGRLGNVPLVLSYRKTKPVCVK